MSVRLSKFVSSACLVTGAMVAVSTPVSAQRWHEVVNNPHIEGKLDMESLRWDGSVVTYQVVYQKPRPGSDEKRTSWRHPR